MGPLTGYKIIEVSGIGPGPLAGMLLADLGAEVIRIDRFETDMPGPPPKLDITGRNKKSIRLNLFALSLLTTMSVHSGDFTACTDTEWLSERELTEEIAQKAVDVCGAAVSASNDVPVFAFFGPSGADHWGPWDNELMESSYTKRNGIQNMGKHRVFSESRVCQPCGKDGCNGSKISDCLMSLDFEKIKTYIQEMLNEKSN